MSANRYRWTSEFGVTAMPTTKNLSIPMSATIGKGNATSALIIPAAEIGAFLRAATQAVRDLAAIVAQEGHEAEEKAARDQEDTP